MRTRAGVRRMGGGRARWCMAWALAVLVVGMACGCARRGGEERQVADREAVGRVGGEAAGEGAREGEGKAREGGETAGEKGAAEGMCKEHGVLEVLCTKCHPKLAAVFQAKGDWCGEHGLPESICPICHPERGGKPAVEVGADGAPADGLKVRLKKKGTAAQAGIETVKAVVREGAGGVVTTARVLYDGTRLAQVNARSAGVVRGLKAEVGTRVKKGETLAVIDSAEVGADRARLGALRSRVEVAEQHYQREKALLEEGVGSQKSVLAARQEVDAARGEHAAIAAALSVLGGSGGGAGGYTLTSPIAGVVTERNATIGRMVNTEQVLFEVVDTSWMWAELEVPEGELSVVAAGQGVTLTLDGLPGRTLKGEITYIAPAVDPHTRTARVRVPLANEDGALRANLYGQGRIAAGVREAVMVPEAAIQRAKGVLVAFVKVSEEEFETRRVEIGVREGGLTEVTRGLRAGEAVVTQGSFLLKTETLKESIGAGCCEVD
ncbi:efflux RND transporter periplasmic adaptor subunit [Chondromyces apiculatus]|nr:efflux RND transporter periplasmic adaptor subunit [Chondromyces apiculatus]